MAPASNLGRKALKAHWNVMKMMVQHGRLAADYVIFDGDLKAGVKYDIAFTQDGNGYEQVIFTPK